MSGDLQNAISLIKSGHKEEGQAILVQILEEDSQNEKAWIWMSAVVETDEMRLECLEEVLKINPNNQAAQKGAEKLREKIPPQDPTFADEPNAEADFEIQDEYADEFEEDDGWYDPIEPEPITGYKEEFSYEDYAPEPDPDIKIKSTKDEIPPKRSILTHSPWLTIWYRPRPTIRAIIESDPKKDVLLIAILIGLLGFFSGMMWFMMVDITFLLIGMVATLIIGPLIGVAWLYITGAILGLTGMMLGGKGTGEEIRAALAWGNIPTLAFTALMVPFLLMMVATMPSSLDQMLTTGDVGAGASIFLTLGSCFAVLSMPFFLYGFYFVFLQSLAEAHQFSGWRAFGSVLLPGIILNCTVWLFFFISGLATAL